MHRSTAGLLTVSLLGVGAGSVLAQPPTFSPETPSWRVEVPEAGLALDFPTFWQVVVRMAETGLGGYTDDPDRSWWIVLDAESPHPFKDVGHGGCDVWLFRTDDPSNDAATLSDIWGDADMYWTTPMYAADHTETTVDLPTGPATRFDFADEFPWGYEYHADYRIVAPDGVVWLMCQSTGVRPDDSIAKTFEFLPAEE
jgi:hypothetical protein